jgi:MFS family permease
VFSFFSKPIVDKLGNRYSLALGCFFEAFHLFALVIPALRKEQPLNDSLQNMYGFICFFICLCAIIAGIGTSLLWVSLGRYVTLCANDTNKGFFNAVFWVFMMTCQVVGNILGATIITKIKQSTFFIGFTILALIAAAWMMGLPTPKPHPAGTKSMPGDEEKPLSPKKEMEIEMQDVAPATGKLTKEQR